jgi:hypothetical protein
MRTITVEVFRMRLTETEQPEPRTVETKGAEVAEEARAKPMLARCAEIIPMPLRKAVR